MYEVKVSKGFKKSFKRVSKDIKFKKAIFDFVVFELQCKRTLEEKFLDHPLSGELKGYRECHLAPDLLLIYQYLDNQLILYLLNIGSHSDLF